MVIPSLACSLPNIKAEKLILLTADKPLSKYKVDIIWR